jgi:branched-chain amino acid transport system substrate-binding protein
MERGTVEFTMRRGLRPRRTWRAGAAVAAAALALTIAGCASSGSSSSTSAGKSAAASGGTPVAGGTPSGAPLKIGYLCLCAGAGAASAPESMGAFTAWVKWTNAHGGVNGHPIQLITAIDPGNPGVALSQAKKLVSEGIIALAESDADDSAAWASYIGSTGIPVFNAVSATSLTLASLPNSFSPLTSLIYTPADIAAAAKKVGSAKLAVFYCAEFAGCKQTTPAVKAAAQGIGLQVPFTSSVLSAAPNYTAQCLSAQGAGADSVYVASVSQTALRVVASCAQQGYKPHLISAGGAFQASFAGAAGTEGMIAVEPTVPFFDTSNPVIATMTTALSQYDQGTTTSAGYSDVVVWQWATGLLIAQAAKAGGVGTESPLTAAALLAGVYTLHSTNLEGLTPTLTFVKGQPHYNKCWFYAVIKNGKFATPYGLTPTCAS